MKIVAFLTDYAVVDRIIRRLELTGLAPSYLTAFRTPAPDHPPADSQVGSISRC
jgi:hypothetical protein